MDEDSSKRSAWLTFGIVAAAGLGLGIAIDHFLLSPSAPAPSPTPTLTGTTAAGAGLLQGPHGVRIRLTDIEPGSIVYAGNDRIPDRLLNWNGPTEADVMLLESAASVLIGVTNARGDLLGQYDVLPTHDQTLSFRPVYGRPSSGLGGKNSRALTLVRPSRA